MGKGEKMRRSAAGLLGLGCIAASGFGLWGFAYFEANPKNEPVDLAGASALAAFGAAWLARKAFRWAFWPTRRV